MLIGYKEHWKLPIGWFLIKGIRAGILASLISEALVQAFDAGVTARNAAMNGTAHNINTYTKLGKALRIYLSALCAHQILFISRSQEMCSLGRQGR